MIHRLCTDDAVYRSVVDEFGSMITTYSNSDIDGLADRIATKYGTPYPDFTGDLMVFDGKEIGVVFSGVKDVLRASGDELIDGVNVSAWVLSTHRGYGIGRRAIAYAVEKALLRTGDSDESEWHSRAIWTSIHNGNIASQIACEAVGFTYAYPHVELEDRSIYLLQ